MTSCGREYCGKAVGHSHKLGQSPSYDPVLSTFTMPADTEWELVWDDTPSTGEIPLSLNGDAVDIPPHSVREAPSASEGEPPHSLRDLKERKKNKKKRGATDAPPSPMSEKTSDMGFRGVAAAALRAHPAIQAIKEVTNYYPPPELYQLIIEKVGENPDKAKLWRVHMFMKLKGHNPRNYSNLLDRYETGLQYVAGDDKALLDSMVNPYDAQP
jgi:hypothetical protein